MIMRTKSNKHRGGTTDADRVQKKKKGGFVYTKRDPKKIHDRANQSTSQFDGILKNGIDTWRPAVGDNSFRILPPSWDNHDHYGYDVWVHQRVGVDNGSYPCLAKMLKKRCPVCEASKESFDAGETEEAKALQATRKILVWLVDRDDDNLNPQIWTMSVTMDTDIVSLCENKKTGKVLYIDHPDLGYDISMKRKGQALNTRYFGLAIDREPTPISDDAKEQDATLEFIAENPIPSLIKFYDAKYLEQTLSGGSDEKDDELDEEEDEEPKKKKKPVEDDDADEEEAPFDADEEEEPAPKKKKRRPDPDDDEDVTSDDDDETSDDDDEAPVKKKKRPVEDDEDEDETPVKKKKRPEPEEDPDEDEDEEEPPKKKKRKPEPEDDDEEEQASEEAEDDEEAAPEEDDEDDDPPPRRKKKVGRVRR